MKLLILTSQDGTHTNIIQGLNISSLLDDYNYRKQEVFNLQSVQKIYLFNWNVAHFRTSI